MKKRKLILGAALIFTAIAMTVMWKVTDDYLWVIAIYFAGIGTGAWLWGMLEELLK